MDLKKRNINIINKEKKETYQQLETQHVSSPAVVVTASAATVAAADPPAIAAAASWLSTCKVNLKKIHVINLKKQKKKTYQQLETCHVSSPAAAAAVTAVAVGDAADGNAAIAVLMR